MPGALWYFEPEAETEAGVVCWGQDYQMGSLRFGGLRVVKGLWSVTGMLSSLGIGSADVGPSSAVTAVVGFSELEGIAARATFVAISFVVF